MRLFILTMAIAVSLTGHSFAQDAGDVATPPAAEQTNEVTDTVSAASSDFERRLQLAKEMHTIRSTKIQVDNAVEGVMRRLPQDQQDAFKVNMRSILNYNAIEKISVNAMAETFTEAELEAMVEYNKKEEAKSAAKKMTDYQQKVSPEIIRMIDKAVMRMRTGGE